MSAADYTEGQKVVVFENGRRFDAQILSVGRTLLVIGYRWSETMQKWSREPKFRMDTGHTNEEQYGKGTYFKTVEEIGQDDRREAAWAILKAHGVEAKLGRNRLTVEQLEAMAAIVAGEGA